MKDLLEVIPENPVEALLNWKEGLEAIHDEFDRADSEEKRAVLLNVRHALVAMVEPTIDKEDLDKFRQAARQGYSLLLIKECLVGENVSVEDMYRVTEREIAAGRMAPDDSLRTTVVQGMAAPHLTREQLIEMAEQKQAAEPEPVPQKPRGGFFSKLFSR